MIVLKTDQEISIMREAGRISQQALKVGGEAVEPGVSTWELDKLMHDFIVGSHAKPSFLGYEGYPATACISVNDVVIHGIPSKRQILKKGDIVSIDVGAIYKGFNGDNAWTFACGEVSEDAKKLMDTTREALFLGISRAIPGNRIGDIGSAIQQYVEARNYSVVREFVGHGVGADMHEDPAVPNYGKPGRGTRLYAGMTIAIEPMINMGTAKVVVMKDGWTTKTADGKLSAHFEHSIAITNGEPEILTKID
jgi:methionyl aminopeptidase